MVVFDPKFMVKKRFTQLVAFFSFLVIHPEAVNYKTSRGILVQCARLGSLLSASGHNETMSTTTRAGESESESAGVGSFLLKVESGVVALKILGVGVVRKFFPDS